MFRPVVVHEFGHSFGGLADEYFYDNDVMTDTYPLDVEPWEQNISTRIDFISKWEDMLAQGTPVPTPFTVRQTIAACAPMNTLLSARSANGPSAASLNFILNKNKLN